MTSGGPSAGQMLTNAPAMRLTMPGSVLIVTRAMAMAASTALPPSATALSPASRESGLVPATATPRVTPGAAGSSASLRVVLRVGHEAERGRDPVGHVEHAD